MEPIVAAAKTMLESSTGLIQTARSLAVNPKDPPKWSVLAGHSRTVSDSIKKLITNMRYNLPRMVQILPFLILEQMYFPIQDQIKYLYTLHNFVSAMQKNKIQIDQY